MRSVHYVTATAITSQNGGWDALCRNLFRALSAGSLLNLHLIGAVDPPLSVRARGLSKLRRIVGLKGKFFAFNEARLARIRDEVRSSCKTGDYRLFLGVTPWIRCKSEAPYGAYLDACFRTYFDQNLPTHQFCPRDIARIETAEREWLDRATHVFWASAWARDEAIRHYGLRAPNHHVVGIGGNLDVPAADTWNGEPRFVFIAQDFQLKGGPLACGAFAEVYARHPAARLTIIGGKPPARFLQQPGVDYVGYLDKSVPADLQRFQQILASACCLVYPTTSDTIGQVIIECGYFGCPAIAPRRFGIPEILQHRQTGLLLDMPFAQKDFTDAMLWMLKNPEDYRELRRPARRFATEHLTFKVVAERIASTINR